jgi:hypothetical protein
MNPADQTITLMPFGPDIFGQPETPEQLVVDPLALVHLGIGFLLAFLGPVLSLSGALILIGYDLSKTDTPMDNTATKIMEFGIGLAMGELVRVSK